MYKKFSKIEHLGALAVGETLSRAVNSNYSKEVTRFGSCLTEVEMQSLRGEMIRDGAYMKEWLASKIKIS